MDSHRIRRIAQKPFLKFWIFILLFFTLVHYALFDKDFTFLIRLSSGLQTLSFIPILLQSFISAEGISFSTFCFFSISYAFRLCSKLPYMQEYTGDCYYLGMSFVLSCCILSRLRRSNRDVWMIFLALLAGIIVHPTLNGHFVVDSVWAFSMYLEGVALVPLREDLKFDSESLCTHFFAIQSVSRVLALVFWIFKSQELDSSLPQLEIFLWTPRYLIVGSQALSCLIIIDFLYYYVKSAVLQSRMRLPS